MVMSLDPLGQETTHFTAVTQLVHHGMAYVPLGYQAVEPFSEVEIHDQQQYHLALTGARWYMMVIHFMLGSLREVSCMSFQIVGCSFSSASSTSSRCVHRDPEVCEVATFQGRSYRPLVWAPNSESL